ncbi:MAG: hypothetical protein JNK52_13520 [Zoogloeaceae bacterium]|nr:hypothetical protein [Zoogloeaceae bacterium]
MPVNTTSRQAYAASIISQAGSAAKIHLYNGAVPASGGTPAGTLLAECVMSGALGTATGGVITLGAVTGDPSGNANGTPTFYRILTSSDVWVADYPISGLPAIIAGAAVDITGGTITVGDA